MSAQYMPLQGDPPPYNDIERGESQAEPSNTGNDNECLKPGELARVVQYDPIVKVVPMRAGWASSTIEVKRSALPNVNYPFAVLESWMAISYVLICSNIRFLSSDGWAVGLSLPSIYSFLLMLFVLLRLITTRSSFFPIVCSIHVLCFAMLQFIVTVVCYREEREYFGGTMFALITMVLYGLFTIFVIYSHCYEAGEAALAAMAAAESGTADECRESHALPSLQYSQPAGGTAQQPEQNVESSQSYPQSSQVTDLGAVRVVRYDPIAKVFPFGGDWEYSYIIVRKSVLPLKRCIMALLTQLSWIVIPIAIFIAASFSLSETTLGIILIAVLPGGIVICLYGIITFFANWLSNGPVLLFNFVKCMVYTASLQLIMTAVSYYDNRTYFFYNLGALVLLVLFGMVSASVVYQYNYRAGQAALNALEAERARSSLSEDDINREHDSTSKATGRK